MKILNNECTLLSFSASQRWFSLNASLLCETEISCSKERPCFRLALVPPSSDHFEIWEESGRRNNPVDQNNSKKADFGHFLRLMRRMNADIVTRSSIPLLFLEKLPRTSAMPIHPVVVTRK